MKARWAAVVNGGLLFLLGAVVGFSLWGQPDWEAAARAVQGRILTLDSHIDIPPDFTRTQASDPGRRGAMQADLPKMRAGGLDAAFFIVYVEQSARTPENYAAAKQAALVKFDGIHRMAEVLYPDEIGLAIHPDDVERLRGQGKLVALIGIENGFAIGKDLALLEDYYRRGARYMTLAHIGHNDIADSSMPREELGDAKAEHGGISAFGAEVIAEMNRLGMMVDVSHVSYSAMMQAVALSKAPVIASHSSAMAVAAHPRNLTDEQMWALAAAGGVMQVVAYSDYVVDDEPRREAWKRLRETVARAAGDKWFSYAKHGETAMWRDGVEAIERHYPKARLGRFVDHIDHAVAVMGIDHVGIASDFGGGGGVRGWNDAAETYRVTAELLRRGYSERDIAKLWGGNLLRVWRQTEAVAAELTRSGGE